ncbi:MAG: hypothetical protein J3R72DRAFT_461520 [Linnemannia gamsii]|nr:MAG: hypothetical protein J3R72DRAFT_461520 [Linnemannia gamsii]
MSTSFPLPLECLQMIIRQLANDGDANTLTSLLRTNKHICSATLPILYQDPFQVLSIDPTVTRNVPSSLSKLIRLLLCSNHNAPVSELLRKAFLQDLTEPEDLISAHETTAIPYHSLITSVGIQPCSPLKAKVFQSTDAGFVDYLWRCKLADRFVLEGIFELCPTGTSEVMSYVATQELLKDLAWALCASAERIRSLVIPISDVTRYLSMVGRLELLADVTFVLDKNIRGVEHLNQMSVPTRQEVSTRLRAERIRHVEDMVLFVQEHRRLFPNVLATGRCIKERLCNVDCPEEYQLRILQLLPPLIKPRSIDHNNWTQFITKAQDTNLSFVKSFEPAFIPENASLHIFSVLESQLQRCRSLEYFKMSSINESAFHWAVDERRRYNADIAAGRLPQHALVPLRSFVVRSGKPFAGHQINDVAFAFSNTLESIEISGQWRLLGSGQDGPDSTIDDDESTWFLPRLSKLMADMGSRHSYLHLPPEFLSRCPRLVTVNLCDRLGEYNLGSVHQWKPAALPHLTSLRLRGTPAATFHPDTLKNTPELVELRLGISRNRAECFYIPPPEQFIGIGHAKTGVFDPNEASTPGAGPSPSPPIWTWDWELPKLTNLTLVVEFAYRFQFRMLDGTPNLEKFECDVRSLSQLHKRTLRLEDLLSPGFRAATHRSSSPALSDGSTDINNTDKETELKAGVQGLSMEEKRGEYIRLSALNSFSLIGPWTLSVQVLETLFTKVFPQVKCLDLHDCVGFTPAEWVNSTSSHLHWLTKTAISTRAYRTELVRAGLTPGPGRSGTFVLIDRPPGRIEGPSAEYKVFQIYP